MGKGWQGRVKKGERIILVRTTRVGGRRDGGKEWGEERKGKNSKG